MAICSCVATWEGCLGHPSLNTECLLGPCPHKGVNEDDQSSVPRAERNKAFIIQDKLGTGNATYVGTVVNLIPTMPGTQDLFDACMTQASFDINNCN